MMREKTEGLKREMTEAGRWLWEKELSAALSGNLSVKLAQDKLLITGHGVCLGALTPEDIGEMNLEGRALAEGFAPSAEKPFHTSVYKEFVTAGAVVHAHPVFTNAYFISHDHIEPLTFETRLSLGSVPVLEQKTPAITDIAPVMEALRHSNIVVLRHHGVVAMGETLRDAFFLVQMLEEAVKAVCIRDFYAASPKVPSTQQARDTGAPSSTKRYKLFSKEQIEAIVAFVNRDETFERLSRQTALETRLAVVLEETQEAYCFHFSDGKIADYQQSADGAEFVISGRAQYWRAIFNGRLDPFAATTQKKLKLKGDFAKISRWFVPFNRLFELWKEVPVES